MAVEDVCDVEKNDLQTCLKNINNKFKQLDGLVAHYPFDDNANDVSGNGNHGKEHGGLKYVTGKIGQAAQFDGIDDYISLPSQDFLGNKPNWTFSAFVKLKDKPAHSIYGEYGKDAVTRNFILYHARENGIVFNNYPPSGSEKEIAPVSLNSWHFITVVRNSDILKIYIDGSLKDKRDYEHYSGDKPSNAAIGSRLTENNIYNSGYSTDGLIDDVRIYNRALSDSEIQSLFNLK